MEKSFTAQLGAGEQGPRRASSRPLRTNCSAVTSTWCVWLLGSLCRVRTRLLTRGRGTGEGWRGGDRTPSYTSLEATPPVHLLGPNCSGVPVSAAPKHPDCRPSGSLMTPSLSHHASQAASPAPKSGDSAPFLSASPPPAHPGPGPESVHLSLDPTAVSCSRNCQLCTGCALRLEHPPHPPSGPPFAAGHQRGALESTGP